MLKSVRFIKNSFHRSTLFLQLTSCPMVQQLTSEKKYIYVFSFLFCENGPNMELLRTISTQEHWTRHAWTQSGSDRWTNAWYGLQTRISKCMTDMIQSERKKIRKKTKMLQVDVSQPLILITHLNFYKEILIKSKYQVCSKEYIK